jgi:hypothetical protein
MLKRLCATMLLVVVGAGCSNSGTATPSAVGPDSTPTNANPSPEPATGSPRPFLSPTASPSSSRPDDGSFTDPEGHYRISVADNWEPNHGAFAEGIEVWYTGPLEDDFQPNVNVLTQAVGAMTLEEYTQLSLETAPSIVQDFELLETHAEVGVNGTELVVFEYKGEVGASGALQFLAVWTVHDGKAIVATLTAKPATYQAQREAALPYLLTLEPS